MKPINVPTIPLNDAISRVQRFRDQLVKQVPEANIPRAILIPINDLLAIVERHSTIDAEGNIICSLKGVRAYFAVKLTDQDLPDDVTALIVPVDQQGNDIVTDPAGLQGTDDTEIYDFTKPCPDVCDPDSPLFVD